MTLSFLFMEHQTANRMYLAGYVLSRKSSSSTIQPWFSSAIALLYPHIVIDDSSWKNAAESFTVALTLTLGEYESAIAPVFLPVYDLPHQLMPLFTVVMIASMLIWNLQWQLGHWDQKWKRKRGSDSLKTKWAWNIFFLFAHV